ncbi:hypothetical protein KIW84_070731, partial [Lathyrus oleraceus]
LESLLLQLQRQKVLHIRLVYEDFKMTSCSSAPDINIKAVYCPEAVIEWYRLTGLKDRKESLSRRDLALKAKQHLVFLKWVFWHVNKKGKKELRYTSPKNGKNYISLRKACESCIEDGGCSTLHSSTMVQVPTKTISSSPKRPNSFGEIDQLTFNKDSEVFSSISLQKFNVATISQDVDYSTLHSSTTLQVPPTDTGYSTPHSSTIVQVPPTDAGNSTIHSSRKVQVPPTTTSSFPLHLKKGSEDFGEIVQ